MDYFKSAASYHPFLYGSFDHLDLVTGLDTDDVQVRIDSATIVSQLFEAFTGAVKNDGKPFYLRGDAVFTSFDDAKNDYLMEPEPTTMDDDDNECVYHAPIIMVIPFYNGTEIYGEANRRRAKLQSVSIVLMWQELS